MATVPTQIRIDENLKKQATELFSQLGMDMSGAMNIFLKQCVLRGGHWLKAAGGAIHPFKNFITSSKISSYSYYCYDSFYQM